jgi:hypothetical protein
MTTAYLQQELKAGACCVDLILVATLMDFGLSANKRSSDSEVVGVCSTWPTACVTSIPQFLPLIWSFCQNLNRVDVPVDLLTISVSNMCAFLEGRHSNPVESIQN